MGSSGCVAKINDSALLYSGGASTEIVSYMYDVERDTWTRMSDLSEYRSNHGCGSIDAQEGSGNREIIAAGGLNSASDSVEKYNMKEDTWILGNELPFGLFQSDSVPYGDSFILVGGVHKVGLLGGFNSDAILLYKSTDDSWDVMEG